MNKNDVKLVVGILVAALLLVAGYKLYFNKSGEYAKITIDGKTYQTLPLNKNKTITIKSKNGGKNVLQIKDGYASITNASCPDKLCVHQKKINKQGEALVCLPNKVIVTIVSKKKAKLDNVAY